MSPARQVISAFILVTIITSNQCLAQDLKKCGFTKIFQFGDSMSDTGNSIVEFPKAFHSRFPYGETIHKATGRTSDGLLIIDRIAESAGLSLLQPYENPRSTFPSGVDFAVAGVTALSTEALAKLNIPPRITNNSLEVQIQWFEKYLSTVCNTPPACQQILKSALFMLGEFGGNDYDAAFIQNQTIDEVKRVMVPQVIGVLINSAKVLISRGAVRIVVPGLFKLGCAPASMTLFQPRTLDANGCLKDFNDFFTYHNSQLQLALQQLQTQFPNVHIAYGDFYNSHQYLINNMQSLGIKYLNTACCGKGGKYNYTPGMSNMCGNPGITICPNPSEHVFWDEWHFTHHSNLYMAQFMIRNFLPKLQC